MRSIQFQVAAVLLAFFFSASAQDSLQQVIDRNIEARGGYEAWKAVQTLRISGLMELADGSKSPVHMDFKRPHKMRMDYEVQGMAGILAFDGQVGWAVEPGEDGTPRVMEAQALPGMRESADFEGPLIDWQKKGHQLSLEGSSDWSGKSVYRIRMNKRSGEQVLLLIDTETFLEIGQIAVTGASESTQPFTALGNHVRVGGLVVPFSMKTRVNEEQTQTLVFDSVEVDVDIPDSRFRLPR